MDRRLGVAESIVPPEEFSLEAFGEVMSSVCLPIEMLQPGSPSATHSCGDRKVESPGDLASEVG